MSVGSMRSKLELQSYSASSDGGGSSTLTWSKVASVYGTATYGTVTYGGQSNPLVRQPIEGSGFSVALRVVDNGVSAPYSLKGFQLEFDAGARR